MNLKSSLPSVIVGAQLSAVDPISIEPQTPEATRLNAWSLYASLPLQLLRAIQFKDSTMATVKR